MKRWLLISCLALIGASYQGGQILAKADGDGRSVADPRMSSAEKLIYNSRGAKQITRSDNEDAHSLHREAKELYQQAIKADDNKVGSDFLNQSLKKMMIAIREATPKKTKSDKQRNDCKVRQESIEALLKAHDSVAEKKNQASLATQLRDQVEVIMSKAGTLYHKSEYGEARKIMDGAYIMVKTSIKELRGGDTLVRSLNFTSKAAEFEYEVDRNDTHKMLIKVLLERKRKSKSVNARVQKYEDLAREYRQQADESAIQGKYKAAIQLIEKSTKELVRAIRSGGVYIPG